MPLNDATHIQGVCKVQPKVLGTTLPVSSGTHVFLSQLLAQLNFNPSLHVDLAIIPENWALVSASSQ
jgi:hypothetical protein